MLAATLVATLVGAVAASEVWPMPQSFTQGSTPVAVNPATFKFACSSDGVCPDPLPAAFTRYTNLVFINGNASSGSAPGCVSALVLTVTTSVPLDFGVDESYSLDVSATCGPATLSANTQWGALRGLETFSQLVDWLPGNTSSPYQVQNAPIAIQDAPRFQWRGMLIDSSRHYLHVSSILRQLDAMSYNKFNIMHWHFVDDQSWPLVSKTYPNFSASGAYAPDAIYTPDDVATIVSYAFDRGILIIPEFDMPAHASIWGQGYPDLVVACPQGQTLLNPTGPVYTVLQGLLAELAPVFTHGFVHLGGDEVENLYCWGNSTEVQAFMKAQNIPSTFALRTYFESQVQEIVIAANKRAILWEEVFDEGYTIDPSTIVNVWLSAEESATIAIAGFDVIHSYGWYLDQQIPGTPTNYFWLDTWKNFYLNDPLYNTTLTPAQQKHILGGEASMWGEQVDDCDIDQRIWPRASATAERLWSSATLRDTDAAEGRLEHMRCRMVRRGVLASPIRPSSEYGYCTLPADHFLLRR